MQPCGCCCCAGFRAAQAGAGGRQLGPLPLPRSRWAWAGPSLGAPLGQRPLEKHLGGQFWSPQDAPNPRPACVSSCCAPPACASFHRRMTGRAHLGIGRNRLGRREPTRAWQHCCAAGKCLAGRRREGRVGGGLNGRGSQAGRAGQVGFTSGPRAASSLQGYNPPALPHLRADVPLPGAGWCGAKCNSPGWQFRRSSCGCALQELRGAHPC